MGLPKRRSSENFESVRDRGVVERAQIGRVVRGQTLHLDQAAAFHFAQLRPGVVALGRGRAHEIRVHEERSVEAVAAQQRERIVVDAVAVIVERQDQRLGRHRRAAFEMRAQLGQRQNVKSAAPDRFELRAERVERRVEPDFFRSYDVVPDDDGQIWRTAARRDLRQTFARAHRPARERAYQPEQQR
jgi:hypothetical protein